MKKLASVSLAVVSALLLASCATESHQALEVEKVKASVTAAQYSGPKSQISIGKFANNSNFQNGIFSSGQDRLGSQAKTILSTHLQQTGRFSVLNRTSLGELSQEAGIRNEKQNLKGARYVVVGDVTEFGRKEVGDKQLFGILGKGKTQIAYAKVALNVVEVATSEVVFAAQGSGEYQLSNREIIGFGGKASYDSTLNGKVLDLAIREAVDNLVVGIEHGAWNPLDK